MRPVQTLSAPRAFRSRFLALCYPHQPRSTIKSTQKYGPIFIHCAYFNESKSHLVPSNNQPIPFMVFHFGLRRISTVRIGEPSRQTNQAISEITIACCQSPSHQTKGKHSDCRLSAERLPHRSSWFRGGGPVLTHTYIYTTSSPRPRVLLQLNHILKQNQLQVAGAPDLVSQLGRQISSISVSKKANRHLQS